MDTTTLWSLARFCGWIEHTVMYLIYTSRSGHQLIQSGSYLLHLSFEPIFSTCSDFYQWECQPPLIWTTFWNKAVRKIWKVPYDSHRVLLYGLNNGQHIWDYIFKRFCKMYDSMSKSTNSILSFLISMSENDCRCILAKNVRHICDKWKFSKADLWKNCKSKKLPVFGENEIKECEGVVEMIKELSKGINHFTEDELLEILAYISST